MKVQALGALAVAGAVALGSITGIDSNVVTWMATPTSANMRSAMGADRTGTGQMVFADTPTLITPILGAATGTSLTTTGAISAGGGSNYKASIQPLVSNPTNFGALYLLANATSLTGSNPVVYSNGSSVSLNAPVAGNSITLVQAGSTILATFATSVNTFANALALGTNPSASNIIRLPNADGISFRNAANNADLLTFAVDSSNNAWVGSTSHNSVQLRQSTSVTRSGIAITSTDGLSLDNSTAATVGVTVQYSTRFRQRGTAYNSTSTLSETQDWAHEVRPATAAGATSSTWALARSLNGAAYADMMTITSAGNASVTGTFGAGAITASNGRLRSFFGSLGTTSTDGLALDNLTAATVGVTVQYSPRLYFKGAAWNSTGAASEAQEWIAENRPATFAGTTTSIFAFARQVAGAGGFTDVLRLGSDGSVGIGSGTLPTSGAIRVPALGVGTVLSYTTSGGVTVPMLGFAGGTNVPTFGPAGVASATVYYTGNPIYVLVGGNQTAFYADGTNTWIGVNAGTNGYPVKILSTAVQLASNTGGNLQMFSTTNAFGGGVGVAGITNATTVPTTNPTGGGVLYAEAGALKWRGSSGTVTVLGVA